MMSNRPVAFLRAGPEHDEIIAAHYMAIWDSYGTDPRDLRPDAMDVVMSSIKEGRVNYSLSSFIGFDAREPVASVSCRVHVKSYPQVLKPHLSTEGYIWSVYTHPEYRGKGIAKKLLKLALDALSERACRAVALHSSEAGKALHTSMGFVGTSELRRML